MGDDEHSSQDMFHVAVGPTSSFVYPVRSLLSGDIQPAEALTNYATADLSGRRPPEPGGGHHSRRKSHPFAVKTSRAPHRRHSSQDSREAHELDSKKRRSNAHKTGRVQSPNFRHFPADDLAVLNSSFTSAPDMRIASPRPTLSMAPLTDISRQLLDASLNSPEPSELNPRHPSGLSQLAQDGFAGTSHIDLYPSRGRSPVVDLTDTGIVLLPPLPPSQLPHTHSSQDLSPAMPAGGPDTSSGEPDQRMPTPSSPLSNHRALSRGASDARTSSLISLDQSLGLSGRSTASGYPPSEEPFVTFRFEHREDGDGHHVMVGREGKLTRCEDEPIRTPGAVQSFGVLIAVHEDTENDRLVVRQVSENSTELLGLSPRYLFSLPCFTDVLPDTQVEVLWDNIQYLTDPDPGSPSEDDSPHVFMLRGYGMPGSALPDQPDTDRQHRRQWACWCAAHRPKGPAFVPDEKQIPAAQDLIILEFEFERDLFNPLYPTVPPNLERVSGVSSPGSPETGVSSPGSTETGSTHSSDTSATTVSFSGKHSADGSVGLRSSGSEETLPPSPSSPSTRHPSSNFSSLSTSIQKLAGLEGDDEWAPSTEDILASTTNHAKPLPALERIRKRSRVVGGDPGAGGSGSRSPRGGQRGQGTGVGMMDVFAVMSQINEQLAAATDLGTFLNVVVGVVKDLTQFHRVLIYQFDESWNGQTVAELVDWNQTHDLYRGLHFPASDIPAQARQLYALNKTRLLYDREQVTARIVVRNQEDLAVPLNMTHSYLRALSPIHLKYLANMGVKSSMSISITAFGQLWGLVACHSYGSRGIRVSFPVRQMLRLLSDSISRNVERLSYAQRLYTRKLFNTITSDQHPTGYIVSNADDLLGLFDADFGVLVIGEGAKILGPNQHGQEVLVMAEYLRLKQFDLIQVTQAVTKDLPDLQLSNGLEVIAGLLYVPLSTGGKDFIAFLRKGQPRDVHWAGKPFKDGDGEKSTLEPRKSFRVWSETVAGRCRAWTDEHLETAGVLALVYGKFIEVWRQKENALQTTKLTDILLSNAGHEVRTPLNHIINCLELALNGTLDLETRENLHQSHTASKSLLFTINDLLDLTRLESGHETSFNEPFDLPLVIEEATSLYKNEATRRDLEFQLNLSDSPRMVVGDPGKIRTVVANLTANALKYTQQGKITISCRAFQEPLGLRNPKQVAVEIIVGDTGCGIPTGKLESIFREFEQVESAQPKASSAPGLGLGLAVVARIVEQLGGQLRVNSRVDEGSRFSFLIPFVLWTENKRSTLSLSNTNKPPRNRTSSQGPRSNHEPDSLADALSDTLGAPGPGIERPVSPIPGAVPIPGQATPFRPVKVDEVKMDAQVRRPSTGPSVPAVERTVTVKPQKPQTGLDTAVRSKIRILIVEDNDINRKILAKRLSLDGHTVVSTTNGQEGVDKIIEDQEFDCVLMDIQMPILNGFEATERIRQLEASTLPKNDRVSHNLNGRIPIFAVSASLLERQREEFSKMGIDGWILKPIDFKRLRTILHGVTDPLQRQQDEYHVGISWEIGGWFPRRTDVSAEREDSPNAEDLKDPLEA